MNVQCERCKTEYDFDDALVSGRGTTVKCTNCGYQFKLRPTTAPGAVDERWVVTSKTSGPRVFTSLKELQRAILSREVSRTDQLTRGDAPARPLASIAELTPFFEKGSVPPPVPDRKSLPPIQPPPQRTGSGTLRPRPSVAEAPIVSVPGHTKTISDSVPPPAPRARVDTLRPPTESALPPPPVPRSPELPRIDVAARAPVPIATSPTTRTLGGTGPAPTPPPPPPASILDEDDFPPPTVPKIAKRESLPPSSDEVAMSNAMRSAMASLDEEVAEVPGVGRPRRFGGWVLAATLLVGVGVIGAVVAKPYLANGAKATTTAPLDPRAAQFLSDGERALEGGNLETAKESFDKASAIAEKDPRVQLDLARVAAARADVTWLALRLLPKDADAEMRVVKQTLAEQVTAAETTADHALALAPDDPAAVRAKLDALRLAGELTSARALVARVIANVAQPETSYVLASLDLAEPDPLWRTVIDRLRVAAGGEGNAGRARAMLVYALMRSGDVPGAKAELEKLAALPRPYPDVVLLRAFVEKTPLKSIDGGVSFAGPSVDVNALPHGTVAANPNGGGGGGAPGSGDGRSLNTQAEAAMRKGDFDAASRLYSQALDHDPVDSEALGGLGDVARARGDLNGAKSSYRRAIAANAMYLPAHLGLADAEYDSGDRASAQKEYKEIAERFPEGAYPPRVKERAEAAAAAAATEATPAATAAPSSAPAATATASAAPTATAAPTAPTATAPAATSTSTGEPPPPKFEPPPP